MDTSKPEDQGPQGGNAQNDVTDSTRPSVFSRVIRKTVKLIDSFKTEIIMGLFGLASNVPGVFVQNLVIEKLYNEKFSAGILHNSTFNDTNVGEQEIQERASQYLMVYYLVRQIPALVLSLFMGHWSDIYGRKCVMLMPLIGNILTTVLIFLYCYCPGWPISFVMFLGIPVGLSGGYSGFMMGIFSHIRDAHPLEKVSIRISILDGIESLTTQMGPLIGQQFFAHFGYSACFGFSIVMFALSAAFVLFRVKDKNLERANLKKMLTDFFRYRAILECFKTAFKKRERNRRAYIITIFVCVFLLVFVTNGSAEIFYLYTRLKLQWNTEDITYYHVIASGCSYIGMFFLLPLLIHYCGLTDVGFGMIGCLGTIALYLGITFATDTIAMYSVAPISMISTILLVSPRSCISKWVSVAETGKAMSVHAILQALGQIAGQIIATQIYVATISTFPGLYYIIATMIIIAILCLYSYVFIDHRRRQERTNSSRNNEAI